MIEATENPQADPAPEAAEQTAARSDAASLLDRVEADLAGVDLALQRLNDGAYGVCVRCGAALADDVLAVDPTEHTCRSCATRAVSPTSPGAGEPIT